MITIRGIRATRYMLTVENTTEGVVVLIQSPEGSMGILVSHEDWKRISKRESQK